MCSAGECQSSSKGSGNESNQASLGNGAAGEGPDSATQGQQGAFSLQRRPESSCCSSRQWLDATTRPRSHLLQLKLILYRHIGLIFHVDADAFILMQIHGLNTVQFAGICQHNLVSTILNTAGPRDRNS